VRRVDASGRAGSSGRSVARARGPALGAALALGVAAGTGAGLVAGCARPPGPAAPDPRPGDFTPCTEPRPEVCTREYRPVCAWNADGSRTTQPNACVACPHADVEGHVPGACETP